jgi:hypothetical protein
MSTEHCEREQQVQMIAERMGLPIGNCPLKGYCRGQYCYMLAEVQDAAEKRGEKRTPPIDLNYGKRIPPGH